MSINRENLKVDLTGILVGVVLVILMGAMSGFFETDPFFGMVIMLLSLIFVKVSYLASAVREQTRESISSGPATGRSDSPIQS